MTIKQAQDKVKEFDEARGWGDCWDLKDLSLNITEEVGELWNLIKWVDDEKQKKIIKQKKEEVENFVGDSLFLVLKIANQTNTDAEKALQACLDEYEKRFPPEKMKQVKHGNKYIGGHDGKQNGNKRNK